MDGITKDFRWIDEINGLQKFKVNQGGGCLLALEIITQVSEEKTVIERLGSKKHIEMRSETILIKKINTVRVRINVTEHIN